MKTAITPTREEDYPKWYQEVVKAAELAENSPVRGCMIIRPLGYGLWENIQHQLDKEFKAIGVENIYCPLFIPLSFIAKEAKHVDGFAKECAVVTHHRLEDDGNGGLKPSGELEEPLVIRPTSETIIGDSFSNWIQSYRDLPLLTNQWANVVRWEMRTRLFLRTSEFLWQEGHTAHENEKEADTFSLKILDLYANFCNDYLAIPVIKGEKTESERFPGAVSTYCIEAMMQDGKALQAGTSHYLGQNFSKAFNISFQNKEGNIDFAHTTSWGVSTRLIGGLIMTHSDDDGLVVPPKVAPLHIIILPFLKKEQDKILEFCEKLKSKIENLQFNNSSIKVKIDKTDEPGKNWLWVKKGTPIRIEVGLREIEENRVTINRRDTPVKEKESISLDDIETEIVNILNKIQDNLYNKAKSFQETNTLEFKTKEDFYSYFNNDKSFKGFAKLYWAGNSKIEEDLKNDLKVTVRCLLPKTSDTKEGTCIFTNAKTSQIAILGRSY